jgi:hypothetical protein
MPFTMKLRSVFNPTTLTAITLVLLIVHAFYSHLQMRKLLSITKAIEADASRAATMSGEATYEAEQAKAVATEARDFAEKAKDNAAEARDYAYNAQE